MLTQGPDLTFIVPILDCVTCEVPIQSDFVPRVALGDGRGEKIRAIGNGYVKVLGRHNRDLFIYLFMANERDPPQLCEPHPKF